MGLQVNNNIPALNAARQTGKAARGVGAALKQLGSGLQINKAADDAAGLAIAERFRTKVLQYTQEANTFQSGINAAQTAEGGLSTQADAVARMRELAVQAGNGTLNEQDRAALNAEAQQLLGQINDTGNNTQFNGQQLLNGDAANIELGTEGGATLNINASTNAALGTAGVDLTTQQGAQNAINVLDTAAGRISENRAALGAQQSRFEQAISQRQTGVENNSAAESAIRDADYARATMDKTRNDILLRGGLGALVQANVGPQSALSLLGR